MKNLKRNESHQLQPRNLRDAMNRFFEESLMDPFSSFFGSRFPSLATQNLQLASIDVDISEDEKNIKIEASIPGYDPKNIEVLVDDNMVIIKGKMEDEKEEKDKRYYRRERSYGEFYREISLPASVDISKSSCKDKNGVLTITVPKVESKNRKSLAIET